MDEASASGHNSPMFYVQMFLDYSAISFGLGAAWFAGSALMLPTPRPEDVRYSTDLHDVVRDLLISLQKQDPYTRKAALSALGSVLCQSISMALRWFDYHDSFGL